MCLGCQSNDAAKRLYRRFNKPDKEELHQLLRDARDSDTQSQQELIEKLMHNVDVEETLSELNEAAEVCTNFPDSNVF
jgi:cell fate (sporulation/competence/biofilm development) regulator YlbF (YheA/YmcA/DUF963 family)